MCGPMDICTYVEFSQSGNLASVCLGRAGTVGRNPRALGDEMCGLYSVVLSESSSGGA